MINKEKEKICIVMVGPSFETQGGISSVLNVYKESLRNDFKVKYISTYLGKARVIDIILFLFSIIKIIIYCLFKREYQIYHIHTSIKGSFLRKYILANICIFFKKKVILHIHSGQFDKFILNSPNLIKKKMLRFLNRVDKIIAISACWKKSYSSFIEDSSKIEIVYNPSSCIIDNYNLRPNNQPVFLYMGRIAQKKGSYDLIEVIKRNKQANYILRMFGDGENKKLKNVVDKEGLNERISINEWVDYKKVISIYDSCDCYVLPSYSEGLPMSILEAMGRGKPIISTNVGGIPEAVINGENGFIFNPGDLDELENCIRIISEDSALRLKMGRKSLQLAKEKFSMNSINNKLLYIYKELLFVGGLNTNYENKM